MTPFTYTRRSPPPAVSSCSSTLIAVSAFAAEMSASLLNCPGASVSVARLQLLHYGRLTSHSNNNNNEDHAVTSVSSSPTGTAGSSSLQIRDGSPPSLPLFDHQR